MAWQYVTRGALGFWVDGPRARGWLDFAKSLVAPAALAAADGAGWARQRAIAEAAWAAYGSFFKAIDLSPPDELYYRTAMTAAYAVVRGSGWAAPLSETTTGAGAPGTLVRAAQDVYARAHDPARVDANAVTLVRMQLTGTGGTAFACADFTPRGCEFGPGVVATGRSIDGYNACPGAGEDDWRCVAWNDAPLSPLRVLPSVRASMTLLAAMLARYDALQTTDDFLGLIASSAGRTPVRAIAGGDASHPPDPSTLADPPGWTPPPAPSAPLVSPARATTAPSTVIVNPRLRGGGAPPPPPPLPAFAAPPPASASAPMSTGVKVGIGVGLVGAALVAYLVATSK